MGTGISWYVVVLYPGLYMSGLGNMVLSPNMDLGTGTAYRLVHFYNLYLLHILVAGSAGLLKSRIRYITKVLCIFILSEILCYFDRELGSK